MHKAAVFVLFSLFYAVTALSNGNTTINFGVSLTLTGPPSIRLEYGLHTRDGILLWLNEANINGVRINNQTMTYNVTILDDAGTSFNSGQNNSVGH